MSEISWEVTRKVGKPPDQTDTRCSIRAPSKLASVTRSLPRHARSHLGRRTERALTLADYGRGAGVGRGLGVGEGLGVDVGVGVGVGLDAGNWNLPTRVNQSRFAVVV